ncbi:MAG: polyphosphate--glucose phosphotransferase [Bacteroidia bacterium]
MDDHVILGIDIGGTGMKGAPVNVHTGELLTERFRIPTPQPANPESMTATLKDIVDHFEWKGPIGCGFPAAVQLGVVRTASNIDKSWIGVQVEALFSKKTNLPVSVVNDADAAGLASARFGAGKDIPGVMVFVTVGTGIGTALFIDGKLVPNTELGHVYLKGHTHVAEKYCANSIRKNEELSWEIWGNRLNEYLNQLHGWFYPNKIILGGGQSKKWENYEQWIDVPCETVPATLLNHAGIIGAAMAAVK